MASPRGNDRDVVSKHGLACIDISRDKHAEEAAGILSYGGIRRGLGKIFSDNIEDLFLSLL